MDRFVKIFPGYYARGLQRVSCYGKTVVAYTITDNGDRVSPENGSVDHIRNKAGRIKRFRSVEAAIRAFGKENS